MFTPVQSIDWPDASALEAAISSARRGERPLVALAGRRRLGESPLQALASIASEAGCAWIDADETAWLAQGVARPFALPAPGDSAEGAASNGPAQAMANASIYGNAKAFESQNQSEAFALATEARAALLAMAAPEAAARHLRAFGALPFDPRRPGAPLGPSSAGAFFIPRWTLRQVPGESEALVFVVVEAQDGDTPGALRARLKAEWEACERWLAERTAEPAPLGLPAAVRGDVAAEQAAWAAAAGAAIAELDAGRLDKVAMARALRFQAEAPVSPWALWAALAAGAPGTQRFCWVPAGESAFVGASPELLFAHAGRALIADGLAGTAPRAATPSEDEALGAALLADDKERREHAYVVTALEAALSPLCEALEVPEAPVLRRLPTVQHLHSPLRGTLAPGVSTEALLRALHPTPAVGGTPRPEAVAMIRALEPDARGFYAGPIGWVDAEDAAFAVGIRSAFVWGDQLAVIAGAGLVRGSNVQQEWAETERKASPFLRLFRAEAAR